MNFGDLKMINLTHRNRDPKRAYLTYLIIGIIIGIITGSLFGSHGNLISTSATYYINGSTTVQPIMDDIASAWMEINPDVDISVMGTGSGTGIKSLANASCDLAMSSRPLNQQDLALNKDLINWTIGFDAIAIIINDFTFNALENIDSRGLSLEELEKIYNGTYTNWDQIDSSWPSKKITIVGRTAGSGTRDFFYESVLKGSDPWAPDMEEKGSNGEIFTFIKSNDYAIGFCGISFVKEGVEPININGFQPTPKNVLDKNYPISRSLFLVTNGIPPKGTLTRQLIDFLHSELGQYFVAGEGFIPIPKDQIYLYSIP
ncbi:MAG: PstS family phosphate ABC transporter substrate-binding protein [Promethearchaeota archaeon]